MLGHDLCLKHFAVPIPPKENWDKDPPLVEIYVQKENSTLKRKLEQMRVTELSGVMVSAYIWFMRTVFNNPRLNPENYPQTILS
jgi:hypothetical protein